MKCAVLNCKNTNKKPMTKFFRFPQDEKRFKQWKDFCGPNTDIDSDKHFMCNYHFKPTDFERDLRYEMGFIKRFRPRLLPTAVPTIHPNCNIDLKTQPKDIKQLLTKNNLKTSLSPQPLDKAVVENEVETDPLDLEIKVEPETITENYNHPIDIEVINIKSEEEEDVSQNNFESLNSNCEDPSQNNSESPNSNEIQEEAELHPMQKIRNQVKTLKRENLVLRRAAKQHVMEIGNLNRNLKRSEFLRMNMEKNLRLIFTEGQMKKLKNGTEKRLVWGEKDLSKAIELYTISRKAYEFLQKNNHPLPSVRTIQHWLSKNKVEVSNSSNDNEKHSNK